MYINFSSETKSMPSESCHRFTRLIELNKDIHSTSAQIAKTRQDLWLLRTLVEEFSRLVFDKLALDAVFEKDFDSDVDLQALRVIIGRTKIAMQFFTAENAPLSPFTRGSKSNLIKISTRIQLESCYPIYISRKQAERRLCKLTDQLVQLQKCSDGLTGVIRRFEEDNKALRSDIVSLSQLPGVNYELNFGQHTWARLAGVDLMATVERRKSICSQRRTSSINLRRMSTTSTKSFSYTFPTYKSYQPRTSGELYNHPQCSFSSNNVSQPIHPQLYTQPFYPTRPKSMHANMDRRASVVSSRRRSGALSDLELSGNDSFSSTSTSFSTHSYSKPGPQHSIYPVTHQTTWNPRCERLRVVTTDLKI